MDNLILSNNILNQQICTECLNYLSVGPVMVSCEGKIICGRCSPNKQSELKVLNHSLYNLVAEKLVFRCINYYEGCEELLNFNEAVEHEKNCKKEGLKCPFCDYKGNGCQLVQHFDENHPEYVVKEDTFKIVIKETCSKNLIFVKKNCILCLIASISDTFIEFFNLLISPTHLGPKHFKLRFFKSDTNIEFVTSSIQIKHEFENFPSSNSLENNVGCGRNSNEIKNSFLLDKMPLLECFPSERCSCKMELAVDNFNTEEGMLKLSYLMKIFTKTFTKLSTDFVKTMMVKEGNEQNYDINCVLKMPRSDLRKFVNTDLPILQHCVSCQRYITPTVYFCPKYHMACKKCSNSKCIKCDVFCIWSYKPEFNISLPCEWNGCSDCPDIFNYVTHKRDCLMRRYKCPDVDCEFEDCLIELKKHWHINPFFDCNSFKFKCKSRSLFWHIRDFHEMFYVFIEYNFSTQELGIIIKPVDVVMPSCYEFRADFLAPSGAYQNVVKETQKDGNDFIEINIIRARLSQSFRLIMILK